MITRSRTAHPGIEEIADLLELTEALDDQLGTRITRSRLHLHIGQAQPSLDESRAQMNVLNPGIGQIHLPPEQDADLHVNALVIETIAQRVIAKVQIRE